MIEDEFAVPEPHLRTLPHVPLNEQGIRELEEWLLPQVRKSIRAAAAAGWRFNVVNNGADEPSGLGWGYVQTNDCVDFDTQTNDPIAIGGDWGFGLQDDSGCGLAIGSNLAPVYIKSRGSRVKIISDGLVGGGSPTPGIVLNPIGTDVTVDLGQSGDSLVINDHLGSPIVTWTG